MNDDIIIEIKDLHKTFGTKEILRGVNLKLRRGKCTAIFGLSGGGKSTIIKHIVGLLKPTKGSIIYKGRNIATLSDNELRETRKHLGFLFQSGALFDSMNVYENVAFPLREHTTLNEDEIKKEVIKHLEIVGLESQRVMTLAPDELSGGMRKRVGLARTIILKPEVLLYDEPTSGLDPITSDTISQLILQIQKDFDTTSILISHDIKETFKSSDYFAMLYEGKIIEYGNEEEFRNSKNKMVQDFLEGRSS